MDKFLASVPKGDIDMLEFKKKFFKKLKRGLVVEDQGVSA
jgi:hypothetical protein